MSMNELLPQEMRTQVRIDISEVVRVLDRHKNRDIGQLVNISEDGLMLLMTHPIAENTILELSLELVHVDGDSTPLHIGVESLWCNKGSEENQFWAGFYIIDISEQDQERIMNMLG